MGLDDWDFYTAYFVIARNGEVLHRASWFPGESVEAELGYRCDHAVIDAGEYKDRWRDEGPCGWCESKGKDGAWRPVAIVRCPNCGMVCLDDLNGGDGSFVDHLTDECGQ
jgi:hypothetical protein